MKEKNLKNKEEKLRKKLKNKKQNGITLIALVVTIVILLILASISIGALTGDKGIIDETHTAKENTEIASWEEQIDLAIIDAENKHRAPKLDDVIEELKNKGVITNNEQVKENGDIETNEPTYIITGKLDDYISHIPQGLEIGSEVSYSPVGNYNLDADYYDYSGSDIKLNTNDTNYEITSWKVLDIDRNNEIVKLVPTAPTTGTVKLGGAQGYNNAVKLLNDVCNNLYGYGGQKEGISAESIDIEDIEHYMKDTALEEAHNYTNAAKYGEQVSSAYSKSNSYYPLIYAQEKNSVIDGSKKENGLEMSEQSEFINDTENTGSARGRAQANTSIQPYQTYWYKDNTFMKTAFKDFSEVGSSAKGNFYDIIMPKGTSTTYWVASRCVYANSSYCNFDVRCVISGSVGAYDMYYSFTDDYSNSFALFPVVSLSSELIEGNSTTGYTVNVE